MGKSDQERSQQVIEQMTQQINRWGLVLPAILFLQITKPLSFIGSQGLLLCQPLLSFVYDSPRITEYAELFSDRTNVERLVAQLEADRRLEGNADKEGA
jgi:hypothetical protein